MSTINALAVLAHEHHDRWGRDWDGPPWPFFPIVPILVIAAIWFVAGRRRRGSARVTGEALLAERFARGEIDDTEYRSRRDVLRRRR